LFNGIQPVKYLPDFLIVCTTDLAAYTSAINN